LFPLRRCPESVVFMLVIRKEQMEVFEQAALRNFEKRLVAHIQQYAPQQSEIMGVSGVEAFVRLGRERANGYGFTNQGPIHFYLELMVLLGSDFDTDPQYPWIREILLNEKIVDQMDRADHLQQEAEKYFEKVYGPEDSYEKEALSNISHKRFKDLPSSGNDFSKDIVRCLYEINPYKCSIIKEQVIYELVDLAYVQTRELGFDSLPSGALFVLMMFKFGHRCCSDLQYPWIMETLKDSTILDPDIRIQELHSKIKSYCWNSLDLLEKK
jgi:hypothetical protein